MVSVHGAEIDELMVDTVVGCDSHIDSIEEGVLAALKSDCHSMLFSDLKHPKVFDTYGLRSKQIRNGGCGIVALWLSGASLNAWIIRPQVTTGSSLSHVRSIRDQL